MDDPVYLPKQEAIAAGHTVYQGKPCKYGHRGIRYICKGTCTDCLGIEMPGVGVGKNNTYYSDRREAREAGHIIYNGKPCKKHGHSGMRYVCNGQCIDCDKVELPGVSDPNYLVRITNRNRAKGMFSLTYEGLPCYKCGTTTKYTSSCSCVNCLEMREKQLKINDPDKYFARRKASSYKRRALEEGGISTDELNKWQSKQVKICYYCGTDCKNNYHVDHFFPLSKGGPNTKANLVIACPTCNLRKSNKYPCEFMREMGLIKTKSER